MYYFKIMCFLWAAIGIGSRIAMGVMKEKWAVWEQNSAYKENRPAWVISVAITGLVLIAVTWYVYLSQGIAYGWVLALLITLTGIKIVALLFQYNKFRGFVKTMLASKQKMLQLNISVIILSAALIAMALFLYK